MQLTQITAADFDLAMTLDSGQVFHWARQDLGFLGAIAEAAVYIQQEGDSLKFMGASPKTIARYFALDHALLEICASFPDDVVMDAARDFCRGLRIIRQPKWECLATFICSSMKQVAHIRQISDALRRRFGNAKQIYARKIFTFPSAERLAGASERELCECALGYRAKNLLATARRIASGEVDLEAWSKLSDSALQARLCDLPGVGAKVANCVMLFAYERIAAFPIDVWIERVLREKYFASKRKVTAKTLANFARNYFGAYGGYAQQYLFHHARKTKPTTRKSPRRKSWPSHDLSRR